MSRAFPPRLSALSLSALLLAGCGDSSSDRPPARTAAAPATTTADRVATARTSGQVDDHGDSTATATALPLAQPVRGTLETGTDVDVFAFLLQAGATYDLSTNSTGDTLIALYDPAGNQLAAHDDRDRARGRLASRIEFTPTAPGSYTLHVTGRGAPIPYDVLVRPALPRGLRWVRENPMFLSALTVSMGAPPPAVVDEYLDVFGATAAHTWSQGLPRAINGWRNAGRPVRWLSWIQDDGTSADPAGGGQALGGVAPNLPGRIGYQIGDEPRTMSQLLDLVQGVGVVRRRDPGALTVVNFSFHADQLDALLDHAGQSPDVDVLSHDDYTTGHGAYARLLLFRDASLRNGKPYWRYLTSFHDGDDRSEADMRWHTFAGLLHSYTGHTWFVYQIHPAHRLVPTFFQSLNSWTTPRTARFRIAARINREQLHLGEATTQLTSTDVRYVPAISFVRPRGTRNWQPGAGGDPYLTGINGGFLRDLQIGFFTDDYGQRYFMVQNVNHDRGRWPTKNDDPVTARLTFDFSQVTDPAFATDRLLTLNKDTGLVEELALQPLSNGQVELSVRLAAGDVILLKYKTDRPFARR
jgi:Bacterial pre-peptidase C-terminal domain